MESIVIETIATEEFAIKVADGSDVIEAFYISKVIMSHMLKNHAIHPDLFVDIYETLRKHAESRSLFILHKDNVSLGFLTFDEQEPDEFKDVNWPVAEMPCLYISRIYVLPFWRNRGVGSTLLKHAEQVARVKGYGCIRVDSTSSYEDGNLLLMKHNYQFVGNVFYNFQKAPVNCYQKEI